MASTLQRTLPLLLLTALLVLSAPPRAGAETHEIRYPDGTVQVRWESRTTPDGERVRHGSFVRFHPDGSLAMRGWYRDGEPVGTWSWWDEERFLLRTVRYEYGIPMPLFGQGLESPITTFTKLNGEKTAEGQLKGTTPHGRWLFWYEEGVPKAEGEYISGIPHGHWIYFYRNGQVERDVHYEMGILHGEYREGYPSGQERRSGRMAQGLKSGPWRFWYPDGRVEAEGRYFADLPEGEWRFWNESGELIDRVVYQAGRPVDRLPLPRVARPPEPVIPITDDLLPPPPLYDEEGNRIRPKE